MTIRYIVLILLSILFWRHGYAQYPTAGTKQRLGYQTTGDGLVFRGNGSPAYTPSGLNSAWAYIDTTAGTIYTYYAGSWHLVSAGGGGGSTFDGHVDSLVFSTSVSVVDSIGKMYYDASNETISVGIDGGAVYQMGQELYYPIVINKSGATIHNGQPVMVDTATLVTGDHVRIIPARNGATYPSDYVIGVATTDIPNDSTGLVTWFGYVLEVKHSDIAATGVTLDIGEILYISASQPGKYTDVAPTSPAHKSTIALVVRKPNDNNITLLVRPWLAPRLSNLSDVNTSSVTGLSVLRYNSTSGTWDASATAGIVAADTATMLSYYLRKVDTLSLSNRINLKLNIADTTAMLSFYQKKLTLTTSGTSGAATLSGQTLNIPQYQAALTNPVTGTGTSGQVAYWNGSTTQTGSNNLFFDNTNKRLYLDYQNYRDTYYSKNGIIHNTDFAIQSNFTDPTSITLRSGGGFTYGAGAIIFSTMVDTREIARFTFATSGEHRRLGIGTTTPAYTIDANTTVGIRFPLGTTAQRPTGAAGVVRYNSDSLRIEYHTGTAWKGLAKTEELPVSTSGFPRAAPVAVITSTHTVGTTTAWLIVDYAGTVTLTLPSASTYSGREIMLKTIRAQSVISASSNVVPIDSNVAGTAILPATAGKWATLVSDGTNWQIMQSN